jgi:hypothetical protein
MRYLIRWACVAGFLGLAFLPETSFAQPTGETIQVDPTFRTITMSRRGTTTGLYEQKFWFKFSERDGRVHICGAYTAPLGATAIVASQDALRNHDSILTLGQSGDSSAPKVSPLGWVLFNPINEPLTNMKAGCFRTEHAWKPQYARDVFSLKIASGRGW